MKITFSKDEYWYGGYVVDGAKMPIDGDTQLTIDLRVNATPNQGMPFFVSSKGRYLWRETGFQIQFDSGMIDVPEDVILEEGYKTLRGAYLAAMSKHFPFEKKMPARELFSNPIYNTWIELTFFQSQHAIEQYAKDILANDLPAGVLMIDDGWSNSYGDWRFHSGHFPNPKKMITDLKSLGFHIMLWICPFVTCDSVKYREAVDKKLLVLTSTGEPFITKWWNGYSAVLDMTNPATVLWLKEQLSELQSLGVDGFKFDAGDSIYFQEDNITFANATPNEQSIAWEQFGEQYNFNEYRVTFKAGGRPVLQRLCDKNHSWGDNGIASLIPDTLAQGITGHPYCCPDMIGGGEYLNFQDASNDLDSELFIRHAEIACLMPAMQFSAAPYRILNAGDYAAIKKSVNLRKELESEIEYLIEQVQYTGEPVIRYMAYEFPAANAERVIDQFMLGSEILVAPIIEKGKNTRSVFLPKGKWLTKSKEIIEGTNAYLDLDSELGTPIVLKRF